MSLAVSRSCKMSKQSLVGVDQLYCHPVCTPCDCCTSPVHFHICHLTSIASASPMSVISAVPIAAAAPTPVSHSFTRGCHLSCLHICCLSCPHIHSLSHPIYSVSMPMASVIATGIASSPFLGLSLQWGTSRKRLFPQMHPCSAIYSVVNCI